MAEENKSIKTVNKKAYKTKKWYKHNLFILLLFFVFVPCSCIALASYKGIKENLYIKNISKNILSYKGKLNIQRKNYQATAINDHEIIVIGFGSKIAEIYDLRKMKTVKEIELKNYYNNDFLYKISDNEILVIGHTIEIIDTKNSITEKIQIPQNIYMFTKGFAFKLNDEEIYILLGRNLGAVDDERTKSFIYNLKSKEIKETTYVSGTESLFLDNVRNMFVNINGNVYTAGCSYEINEIKSNKQTNWKYIPNNCNIQKYNNLENKFETIKTLEDKFPYYILKWKNNSFIILYNDKVLNYNTTADKTENINFTDLKPFIAQYIVDIGEGKILLAGKCNGENVSYIVDINNKTVSKYNFIDYKYEEPIIHFGNGNTVQIGNKVYFINLLSNRNVYSLTVSRLGGVKCNPTSTGKGFKTKLKFAA